MLEGGGREPAALPLALRALVRAERLCAAAGRLGRRLRKRTGGEPLVVLVTLGWRLGDEIMALPVYEALASSSPPMQVYARVRHPELLRGNPHVAAINPLTVQPDLVLDLKGEVPAEPRCTTLGRLAGVELSVALRPRVYLSARERAEPPLALVADVPEPRAVLHPVSSQPCKALGRERWTRIARSLEERGLHVIEVGREQRPLGVGLSLVGRTDLRALARVLAQADVVVGDDSGPLHLALAVGTRAVGVFGATDPRLLYPETSDFSAITTRAACRFCWPRRVLAYPDGNCPLARHECMEAIAVDDVVAAAAGVSLGERLQVTG